MCCQPSVKFYQKDLNLYQNYILLYMFNFVVYNLHHFVFLNQIKLHPVLRRAARGRQAGLFWARVVELMQVPRPRLGEGQP